MCLKPEAGMYSERGARFEPGVSLLSRFAGTQGSPPNPPAGAGQLGKPETPSNQQGNGNLSWLQYIRATAAASCPRGQCTAPFRTCQSLVARALVVLLSAVSFVSTSFPSDVHAYLLPCLWVSLHSCMPVLALMSMQHVHAFVGFPAP
jgi:hypothetical protein